LNAYGIFQQYYTSLYLHNNTDFQISWLGSFSIFSLFAFAPAAGILADKVGPQIPMAAGSVGLLVGMFMTSLCREYYQFFLAQGLLIGVSMSFIAIPASGAVPRYFVRNRGLATGITVAGSSLGGVIWPIAFDRMLHQDGIGFPWAMRIGGFIMIPLCVISVLAVRPPIQQAAEGRKEEEGGANGEVDGQAQTAQPVKEAKKKDLSAIRKPPFILLCCVRSSHTVFPVQWLC
jgi:MFS family permease